MNHSERFLNDPIPLGAKMNREIGSLIREVWEGMDDNSFSEAVMWEVIRRLKMDPDTVREKQEATYKFKVGEIVEVRAEFSPYFGFTLEGTWRVMKIMGFQYREPRVPEYYALPIDDLNNLPHHYWTIREEEMRIALNPRCD